MLKALLFIFFALIPATVVVLCLLIFFFVKRTRFTRLYASKNRDERFANALLSYTFADKLIKSPYILKEDCGISPKVDAIVVGGGGIALISYQKGGGKYTAPENGRWTVAEDGNVRTIDNKLWIGRHYISELTGYLFKKSTNYPNIRHYIFLTDDSATADYLSSNFVMGGKELIDELKTFTREPILSAKDQRELINLIRNNSAVCKKAYNDFMLNQASKPINEDNSSADMPDDLLSFLMDDTPAVKPQEQNDKDTVDYNAILTDKKE